MKAAVASIMAARPVAIVTPKHCVQLPAQNATTAITLMVRVAKVAVATINSHYNEKLRRVCGAFRFLLNQKFATINSL